MNKKYRVFPALVIIATLISACTINTPSSISFEDKVATQAAVVFTATALAEQFADQTETPQPPSETTSQPTPEATSTLPGDDPVKDLGDPDARDTLSNSGIWFSNSKDSENEYAIFTAKSGSISGMSKRTGGPIWYAYFEKRPTDLYLEGKLTPTNCSGGDSYGVVLRMEDYNVGPGFYFGVTCDGKFEFYKYKVPNQTTILINKTENSAINTGSGATNTLGVWADGKRFRLYVNGVFLKEIENDSLAGDGFVGFFIWSVNGAGLSVELDEIAYWSLD